MQVQLQVARRSPATQAQREGTKEGLEGPVNADADRREIDILIEARRLDTKTDTHSAPILRPDALRKTEMLDPSVQSSAQAASVDPSIRERCVYERVCLSVEHGR